MQELATLHDRHLNRPTLDDSVDEEQTIEITTKEITQVCCTGEGGRCSGSVLNELDYRSKGPVLRPDLVCVLFFFPGKPDEVLGEGGGGSLAMDWGSTRG